MLFRYVALFRFDTHVCMYLLSLSKLISFQRRACVVAVSAIHFVFSCSKVWAVSQTWGIWKVSFKIFRYALHDVRDVCLRWRAKSRTLLWFYLSGCVTFWEFLKNNNTGLLYFNSKAWKSPHLYFHVPLPDKNNGV